MVTFLPAERFNFWSHALGAVLWLPFTAFLVLMSWGLLSGVAPRMDLVVVSAIYGSGVVFLFFCSAWYHRNKRNENELSLWRTLDHFAIFVMIAASYTPVVWIWFEPSWRVPTLVFQWSVTLVGLGFKVFAPRAPRWIDPVLYLMMGWVALLAIVPLFQAMPGPVFFDLMAGGVWYSVGAVIYAAKWPNPWPKRFGFHELFHVFILGGALSHASMIVRTIQAALTSSAASGIQ